MSHLEITYEGHYSTRCVHLESGCDAHTCMTKFSPTDFFAASLGSCVLTVMALAAGKLGIDLLGAKVSMEKEMSRTPPRRISSLTVHFSSSITVPDEVRQKLETAAKECPVHHSLHPDIQVSFQFAWGIS